MSENTDIIVRHNLKMETGVVIFKACAHVIVGVFTPWSAALAQWINSGSWPEKIVWIGIIMPASAVGGASALLAFLSGSYQQYQQLRRDQNKL